MAASNPGDETQRLSIVFGEQCYDANVVCTQRRGKEEQLSAPFPVNPLRSVYRAVGVGRGDMTVTDFLTANKRINRPLPVT